MELRKLANESRLTLHAHHDPPGTSNWHRIEHRLFCHITQNWRGQPLEIRAATTRAGLKVECTLDGWTYEKGIKVTNAEMQRTIPTGVPTGDDFHPEWNYTIKPRCPEAPPCNQPIDPPIRSPLHRVSAGMSARVSRQPPRPASSPLHRSSQCHARATST